MKKMILIEKRKKARKLKEKGWTNLRIARYLSSGKDNVKRWLEMDEAEVMKDRRGWRKGKLIKYSESDRRRIIEIRESFERQGNVPVGARAIKLEYKRKYGIEISEWFISDTLRKYQKKGDSKQKSPSGRGYCGYPIRKLKNFGNIIMTLEFMVGKRLKNDDPLTYFLLCKYIHPYNLGIVCHIPARTGNEVIRMLKYVWFHYVKPDIVKLSYYSAFGATLPNIKCIGKLPIFLLNLGIKPFYEPTPMVVDRVDLKKLKGIFSSPFYQSLLFPGCRNEDFKIENFYFEYRRRSDTEFHKFKVQDHFFSKTFADVDVENRDVCRFRESKIFFCAKSRQRLVLPPPEIMDG